MWLDGKLISVNGTSLVSCFIRAHSAVFVLISAIFTAHDFYEPSR